MSSRARCTSLLLVAIAATVLTAAPAAAGVQDPTGPFCDLVVAPGPPTTGTFTIEDDGSGLASIDVAQSTNAQTLVPIFTPGTTDPVVVTSTRIDPDAGVLVELTATDEQGNETPCTFALQAFPDETGGLTTCDVTVDTGLPMQAFFTIENDDSGLDAIVVTQSQNADTVVPPFAVDTTDPVIVTSTRIDQTQPMVVRMTITDGNGDQRECAVEFPNLTPPTVDLSLAADPTTVEASGDGAQFTVGFQNTSAEPIVVTALVDDVAGDLTALGTCTDAVGQVLPPNAIYQCSYTDAVTGSPGDEVVRTATVTVTDAVANGIEAAADDTATVTIAGGVTTTTSTTSTTGTTLATTTTSAVGSGTLSRTGSESAPLVRVAGVLLIAGGALVVAAERRRRAA